MNSRAPTEGAALAYVIRPERSEDAEAIAALTKAAFAPMSFSDGTEYLAPARMRADGDLTLSLVATQDGTIIGHAAFSPVRVDGRRDNWFGLGPISVEASFQKQGIGTQMVKSGCETLITMGAKGVILLGNPAVYGPMGFVSDGALTYRDIPPIYVQYLAFTDETPSGKVTFVKGLEPE